jgi:hypothetical protein
MLHAWNEGMASVRSARKDNKLKGLTRYIEAAGFSDPTPPVRPKMVGHSQVAGNTSITEVEVAGAAGLRCRLGAGPRGMLMIQAHA